MMSLNRNIWLFLIGIINTLVQIIEKQLISILNVNLVNENG